MIGKIIAWIFMLENVPQKPYELRLFSMVAVSPLDVRRGQVIAIINLRERIKTVRRRLYIIQHSQMSQAIITITTRQTCDILSYVIEIEIH